MTDRTMTAMYDTRGAAETARDGLVALGIAESAVFIRGTETGETTRTEERGFWSSLFFPDEDRTVYEEGVRRGGYLLTVGSDYNVTALGTMINADGEPVALVSGTAREVTHPEREGITVFTNRQGRFGAAGLAPGKWRVEMLDDARSVFIIDVPADAQGVLRVGEIRPSGEVK